MCFQMAIYPFLCDWDIYGFRIGSGPFGSRQCIERWAFHTVLQQVESSFPLVRKSLRPAHCPMGSTEVPQFYSYKSREMCKAESSFPMLRKYLRPAYQPSYLLLYSFTGQMCKRIQAKCAHRIPSVECELEQGEKFRETSVWCFTE